MRRITLTMLAAAMALQTWSASPARADETIYLLDKTKIVGKLVHFYDGILTVKLPNGTKLQLPRAKVLQVKFKLPKPRAALSTPTKTFKRMRQAALKGDLNTYIDCHSAYYQTFLNHQINMMKPAKFIKRLKKEYGSTQIKILNTKITRDTAIVFLQSTKGDQSRKGELRFVKENNEWKMILPL